MYNFALQQILNFAFPPALQFYRETPKPRQHPEPPRRGTKTTKPPGQKKKADNAMRQNFHKNSRPRGACRTLPRTKQDAQETNGARFRRGVPRAWRCCRDAPPPKPYLTIHYWSVKQGETVQNIYTCKLHQPTKTPRALEHSNYRYMDPTLFGQEKHKIPRIHARNSCLPTVYRIYTAQARPCKNDA